MHRLVFALLIIPLVMGLFPGSIRAEADIAAIEVDYLFGDQVVYRIIIESESSIDKGLIFIRDLETGNTISGNMSFTCQDTLAVCSLEYLQDMETEPLAPFSIIEYWFEIKFENGEGITVPKRTFTYFDNRPDWQVIEQAPVSVYWYDGDLDHALIISNVARDSIESSTSLLSLSVPDRIDIYVSPNAGSLDQLFADHDQRLIAGHARTRADVVLVALPDSPQAERLIEQRVPHEIMHILLSEQLGPNYDNLPVWLTEGLSTLVEVYQNPDYEVLLNDAQKNGTLLEMESICQSFPQDVLGSMLAYSQAASFTRYIYNRFGSSGLEALIESYADGKSCYFGPQDSLGMSLDQLETEWRQDVFGEDQNNTILLNLLPWVLLVGAILFFPIIFALILLRRRDR